MPSELPLIGYGDHVSAVVTIEMGHLRGLPTVHRQSAQRRFRPLPPLSPEHKAYAEALAAAAAANRTGVGAPL